MAIPTIGNWKFDCHMDSTICRFDLSFVIVQCSRINCFEDVEP